MSCVFVENENLCLFTDFIPLICDLYFLKVRETNSVISLKLNQGGNDQYCRLISLKFEV